MQAWQTSPNAPATIPCMHHSPRDLPSASLLTSPSPHPMSGGFGVPRALRQRRRRPRWRMAPVMAAATAALAVVVVVAAAGTMAAVLMVVLAMTA
jgi:hypothetical protein